MWRMWRLLFGLKNLVFSSGHLNPIPLCNKKSSFGDFQSKQKSSHQSKLNCWWSISTGSQDKNWFVTKISSSGDYSRKLCCKLVVVNLTIMSWSWQQSHSSDVTLETHNNLSHFWCESVLQSRLLSPNSSQKTVKYPPGSQAPPLLFWPSIMGQFVSAFTQA